MKFESYFRGASYATVLTAALALLVAGGVGLWLALAFVVGTAVAWKLEGSRWQLSEKVALLVILASLPLFYLDWRVLTPYLQTQYLETGQRGNADITVLAPDATVTVVASKLKSKSKNTPFDGWTLRGAAAATIVGGRTVYTNPEVALAATFA